MTWEADPVSQSPVPKPGTLVYLGVLLIGRHPQERIGQVIEPVFVRPVRSPG